MPFPGGPTDKLGNTIGASKLLVRAYSQAHDEGLRGRCLDRIDALIAHDALGLEQAVEDLSR